MTPAIGFSTGALALSDFAAALTTLHGKHVDAVELSALRVLELEPLIAALPTLDLAQYRYVSVHAPSKFSAEEEPAVVEACQQFLQRGWPIVLHPNAIHTWDLWRQFESLLLIENMDKRKLTGRTADELGVIFSKLPEARLCFDIAHARQYDGSMAEAYRILTTLGDRVGQVHISEVSSRSTHERITLYAAAAFRQVARLIPAAAPVIIESRVAPDQIDSEIGAARAALEPPNKRDDRFAGPFDVFLSYNSHDRELVEQIADGLYRRNIVPWFDRWAAKAGDSWDRSIQDQMETIRCAIIFISDAQPGPWQQQEIKNLIAALNQRGGKVIPVIISKDVGTNQLPETLKDSYVLNYHRSSDPISSLADVIRAPS